MDSELVFENRWGNAGIKTTDVFMALESQIKFEGSIKSILDRIEEKVCELASQEIGSEPSDQSLKRSRGDWYELVIFKAIWDAIDDESDYFALKLPPARVNSGGYLGNFADTQTKTELLQKNLYCSNPDFMVIKKDGVSERKPISFKQLWNEKSNELVGNLELSDVMFIAAAKTKPRPDRRYQHIHEAVTIKTIHELADSPEGGITYHSVMTEMGKTDREVFKYPVPYEIAEEGNDDPAIDSSFAEDDYEAFEERFRKLLENEGDLDGK